MCSRDGIQTLTERVGGRVARRRREYGGGSPATNGLSLSSLSLETKEEEWMKRKKKLHCQFDNYYYVTRVNPSATNGGCCA